MSTPIFRICHDQLTRAGGLKHCFNKSYFIIKDHDDLRSEFIRISGIQQGARRSTGICYDCHDQLSQAGGLKHCFNKTYFIIKDHDDLRSEFIRISGIQQGARRSTGICYDCHDQLSQAGGLKHCFNKTYFIIKDHDDLRSEFIRISGIQQGARRSQDLS